jgi:LAS superfamily LD-carboxypeptidase LdcB
MSVFLTSLAFAVSLTGVSSPVELVPAGDQALTIDLELDNYVNGRMESDRMMEVRGCRLERDAAYTFALLMDAADRAGVKIQPIDCYRSYNHQKAAYNRRCPVTPVPVFETDPITGQKYQTGTTEQRVCTGPPTAKAGASNHGWGRAVDFGDGKSTLGCRDRAFLWLQSNALQFGWVHPPWAHCGMKTQEPWHWEYAGLVDVSLLPLLDINSELVAKVE